MAGKIDWGAAGIAAGIGLVIGLTIGVGAKLLGIESNLIAPITGAVAGTTVPVIYSKRRKNQG